MKHHRFFQQARAYIEAIVVPVHDAINTEYIGQVREILDRFENSPKYTINPGGRILDNNLEGLKELRLPSNSIIIEALAHPGKSYSELVHDITVDSKYRITLVEEFNNGLRVYSLCSRSVEPDSRHPNGVLWFMEPYYAEVAMANGDKLVKPGVLNSILEAEEVLTSVKMRIIPMGKLALSLGDDWMGVAYTDLFDEVRTALDFAQAFTLDRIRVDPDDKDAEYMSLIVTEAP